MLPRIPYAKDFKGFSKAGRQLAELHLDHETVAPWPLPEESKDLVLDPKNHYSVRKCFLPRQARR